MLKTKIFLMLILTAFSLSTFSQSNKTTILLTNIKVWDGTSSKLVNTDILIHNSKIVKISKDIQIADSIQVVDGKGGTAIPGLMDSHQHVMVTPKTGPNEILNTMTNYMVAYHSTTQAKKILMMGVTTIRDLGGPSIDLAKAIDQGIVDGPRIYSSGPFVSSTSGHGDFRSANDGHPLFNSNSPSEKLANYQFSILADGPDNVRAATRQVLYLGAPQVKIMAGGGVAALVDPLESIGYSEAEMRAAVEAAKDYDTYVMAHAYTDEAVQRCIRAGVKDIVHGHLLSEETLKLMAENDVWLGSLSKPVGLMDVPFFTDENRRKGRLVLDGYAKVMELAKKHNVKMGFGTDAASVMVETLLMEFEARSKFFTPLEMLRQATSTNAELLGFSNSRNPYKEAPLGVIKEGAWADILIYNGNPLNDIQVVIEYQENLKLIMKNGVIYKDTL
jgi:imidazolonepropionase-like amidohydrolase